MTVNELVGVMDKSMVFMVYQSNHNELIFDSTEWNRSNYTQKKWKEVRECEVIQFSVARGGEEIIIYISPISALSLKGGIKNKEEPT